MKTITLLCALLWALAGAFAFYNMTIGYSPILELLMDSPIEAAEFIVWLLSDIMMAAFFFVLWKKQD